MEDESFLKTRSQVRTKTKKGRRRNQDPVIVQIAEIDVLHPPSALGRVLQVFEPQSVTDTMIIIFMIECILLVAAFIIGVASLDYSYCDQPLQEFCVSSSLSSLTYIILSFYHFERRGAIAGHRLIFRNLSVSALHLIRMARFTVFGVVLLIRILGGVWTLHAECCTQCPPLLVHFCQMYSAYHALSVFILLLHIALHFCFNHSK